MHLATCSTLLVLDGAVLASTRSRKYKCYYIILHYGYIELTGMIAIAMDIWSDRHASACNPSFVSIRDVR